MRTLKAQLLAALLSGATVFGVLYVAAWFTLRETSRFCPRQHETRLTFFSVTDRIEAHRLANGTLPESLEELNDPRVQTDDRGRPIDGWGRPLTYRLTGKTFDLYSLGRDGQPGGVGLDADLYHDRRNFDLTLPTFHQYLTVRDRREIISFVYPGLLAAAIVAFVVFRSTRDLAKENGLGPAALLLSAVIVTALACAVGVFLLPVHVPNGH